MIEKKVEYVLLGILFMLIFSASGFAQTLPLQRGDNMDLKTAKKENSFPQEKASNQPAMTPPVQPDFQQDKAFKKEANPYAKANITPRIIKSVNKTYGYDVLIDGQPFIHQPNIPGLSGNEGFKTEKDAQKVAEFVANKIRNNKMPPTVTKDDLTKMGVLK